MNKIIQALRQGMVQKLHTATVSVPTINAKDDLLVIVPIGLNQLLIKSIEVTCSKQSTFVVEFFEDSLQSNSRYHSGQVTGENYDVLDLPYVDQEEQGQMYFVLHNTSDFDASYTIEVRGIQLK